MAELEEIRVFVQVVEAQSVSKAAERLNLAISATSRRLKDLETRLGTQLIQRTTRRMSLTEAGRRYYERCRQLLSDLEEATDEARNTRTALHGTLRIAAPLSFGVAHLAPLVASFMHAHPNLEIDMDLSDRRIELVEEGFDVGVRIGALDDSSLIARKLADVRQAVCAAPAFFDRHGRPETPEDLKGLPALTYSGTASPGTWRYQAPDGRDGTVRIKPRLRASNGDTVRIAAIAGLGVVCQPSFIVHSAVEQGLLETVLADHTWQAMGLYAVYPPNRFLPARVRRFVDFLADELGPDPYWERFLDRADSDTTTS